MPPSALEVAASLAAVEEYRAGDVVVAASGPEDALKLILSGRAEATVDSNGGHISLATLGPGELLGDFQPLAPMRPTITVTAASDVTVLRLDGRILRDVFGPYPAVIDALTISGGDRLEAGFLGTRHRLSRLGPSGLRDLAKRLESTTFPTGSVLYRVGESGSTSYYLRAGQIELIANGDGDGRRLALVGPGALIGEEIVLTDGPYAATARTLTPSVVLPIPSAEFLTILNSSAEVRESVLRAYSLKERPRRAVNVLALERITEGGQAETILKDARRHAYYRLTEPGRFLWERLDGRNSVKDLVLAYRERFGTFAPTLVAGEMDELASAGFIYRSRRTTALLERAPRWQQLNDRLAPLIEHRIPLERTSRAIDSLFRMGARHLFNKAAQLLFAGVAVGGFILFIVSGGLPQADAAASVQLYILVPAAIVAIICHELGHALAARAFGHQVQLGIGWYWFGPLLYVDTSDVWLSGKWPRIAVSIAGPYVSFILGSLAGIAAAIGPNEWQPTLWVLAGFSYFWSLWNLDPLLEYDGYYILSDLTDRPNLRKDALGWVGTRMLPEFFRRGPSALRGHLTDLAYGLLALAYVGFIGLTTLTVYRLLLEDLAAAVLPASLSSVLAWVLALIAVTAAGLNVIGDLRTPPRGRERGLG
ncbi:MAG: PqqD family peptide modification chaperone [Chloroflexota bacterium]